MQLISGLRRAGHRVTYSMPLGGYLGRKNLERVRPLLTAEELWASEHYWDPDVVLNRLQADVAITCNVNTFRPPPRFTKDVVQILDLYGPLQFEGLLLDNPDYEAAMHSGALLEERCKAMIQNFRSMDYLVTVSERQKYFWSAYCSLAGFSFAELNLLVCPAAFDIPQVRREPSPRLSVVYSGGFYPWQSPNRFLEQAASILDGFEGATLHVFGGPHEGLANETDVRRFLERLQRHRSVQYHGYRPVEEVLATLSRAWCALELMERNIERELAITGRTLEFLSTGTPVIYNNYSTLSGLIEQYGAGWTVPVEGEPPLEPILEKLMDGGLPLVEELSKNALKLAAEEFSADKAIAPLAQLCGSPELSKRSATRGKVHVTGSAVTENGRGNANRTRVGRVLAISPDAGTLLDLRVRNPLRALHRQGLVDGMRVVGCSLHELEQDHNAYDVILTQRTLPRALYDLLDNLSLNFALEVDDNLLARASYRTEDPEFGIAYGLRRCKAVTMPNPRLVRALERYTGVPLASKAFITPNALPFPAGTADRPAEPPSQIIWIQSDIAALDRSRNAVVSAVEKFSNEHDLPVVLIGKNVLKRPQFRNQVVMGEIDFTANLQLLATAPLSLGVAPLETQADSETLDFIAGKSDLKILLFAGYGHTGVYSAAPPYTDSPLQKGLSIIDNSAADWRDALEYEFREGWKHIAAIARDIQAERNIDKIARENWAPALEAAKLSRPVTGAELFEAYRSSADMGQTPVHSLAYLQANDDVLELCMNGAEYTAWLHYSIYGKHEGRHLRHSFNAQRELMARLEGEGSKLIAELDGQIQGLKQRNESLSRETEQMKIRTEMLERENRELQEQTEELQEKREQLRQRAEDLQFEKGYLKERTERLESENEQLARATERLSEDKAGLTDTLSAVFGSRSWRMTAPLRTFRQRTKRN
jgi:glycosyltransferase involved in cell wall biosynthesis/FtsZ-binding cell division protein ZapB